MDEIEIIDVFTVADLALFEKRRDRVKTRLQMKAPEFRAWAAQLLGCSKFDWAKLSKQDWETVLSQMESRETVPDRSPNIFQFKRWEWRKCATLARDFVPAPDACIELIVDPAYTALEHSDTTGLAVGYRQSREDGANEVILLCALGGRWAGLSLPNKIVEVAEKWAVKRIRIEYTSSGGFDLLVDDVRARTKIRVEDIRGTNTLQAKRKRIKRLQGLVTPENSLPLISFDGHALWVNGFLDQVENFIYDRTKKRDRSREDDMLDAVALLAGFR